MGHNVVVQKSQGERMMQEPPLTMLSPASAKLKVGQFIESPNHIINHDSKDPNKLKSLVPVYT